MYRFPGDPEQKKPWVQAIRCEKWQPNAYSRICSDYFISGELVSSFSRIAYFYSKMTCPEV